MLPLYFAALLREIPEIVKVCNAVGRRPPALLMRQRAAARIQRRDGGFAYMSFSKS